MNWYISRYLQHPIIMMMEDAGVEVRVEVIFLRRDFNSFGSLQVVNFFPGIFSIDSLGKFFARIVPVCHVPSGDSIRGEENEEIGIPECIPEVPEKELEPFCLVGLKDADEQRPGEFCPKTL